MNKQTQDLVNALRNLLAWANIKDGSPSQHLRDAALKAIEGASWNDEPQKLGDIDDAFNRFHKG